MDKKAELRIGQELVKRASAQKIIEADSLLIKQAMEKTARDTRSGQVIALTFLSELEKIAQSERRG
jgi:ribosomal 50S subunit-recycling heat shock protein